MGATILIGTGRAIQVTGESLPLLLLDLLG
jgi:hypothetical protein